MDSIKDSKKSSKALILKPSNDSRTPKEVAFNNHCRRDVTYHYIVSIKKLSQESSDQ
jgi:hypothetical protein